MNNTKRFTTADIFLTILFAAGLVILGFALYFEAVFEAPFYVILGSFSAGLTIAATFFAVLLQRGSK